MDREGFRNRMKQYKKAREENPGLKYWEWKAIPKYDEGGKVDQDEYSPVWPRISKTERQIYFDRINPAAGFGFGDFVAQGMNYYFPEGERQKAPKEDEARWAAYLGLSYDKKYAPDTKIRFAHDKDYPNRQYQGLSKDAKKEIREEIIPTLQKSYSKLGDKWIQITDEKPTDIIRNDEMYYPRQNHIGDLGKFGIREVNGSGIYEVGDKYDFPWYVPIPNRADGHELMIRDTIWSDRAKPELYIQRKAEGGEVQPDPLEVLERSKPKFHGIPLAKGNIDGVFSPIDIPLATLPKVWPVVNKWLPNYGQMLGALVVGDNGQPVNKSAKPIATKRIEPDVEEFYRDIVIPLRPQEDYVKNIYLNRPSTFKYNVYPDDALPSNRVAEYNPTTGEIRVKESMLNSPQLDQTLAHDGSHDLEKLQRTKEAQDIIDEALVAQKNPISKESNLIQEKGAEVTRMGYNAFKYMKDHGLMQVKNPLAKTKAYQDYVINATQEQLAEMMGDFTAYSRDYKAGKIDYDKIRWALTYAPEIAVGLIVPQHLLNGNKEEKQWT